MPPTPDFTLRVLFVCRDRRGPLRPRDCPSVSKWLGPLRFFVNLHCLWSGCYIPEHRMRTSLSIFLTWSCKNVGLSFNVVNIVVL